MLEEPLTRKRPGPRGELSPGSGYSGALALGERIRRGGGMDAVAGVPRAIEAQTSENANPTGADRVSGPRGVDIFIADAPMSDPSWNGRGMVRTGLHCRQVLAWIHRWEAQEFSRYARVVEVDGSSMPVSAALAIINEVLGEVLDGEEAELDADKSMPPRSGGKLTSTPTPDHSAVS